MKKEFLVIVRAGESSTHERWLEGKADRNWDLLVHSFGSRCPWSNAPGIQVVRATGESIIGPKWRAVHSLILEGIVDLEDYQYIFFPDDDLDGTVETINAVFALCKFFNLDLAQPALTRDSYMGFFGITMENTSFLLRYTNFVEIMAPIFSRPFLMRCLPSFVENISGYGLDFLWSSWIESKNRQAILDICPMRHTRAIKTGSLYRSIQELGANPEQELVQLLLKYNLIDRSDELSRKIALPPSIIWGGVLRNNSTISIAQGQGVDLLRAVINGFPSELEEKYLHLVNIIAPILQQIALY